MRRLHPKLATHGPRSASLTDIVGLGSALIQKLQARVRTDENPTKLFDLSNREIQKLSSSIDGQAPYLEREIERLNRRLDNLYAALEMEKVDIDDIDPRIKE